MEGFAGSPAGHRRVSVVEAQHPTALVSYSHDSVDHERRVLDLSNRLRARGIDSLVDQYLSGAPSEGWPLWMERQIEQRDFTLMVCTEAYRRRFMEDEVAGVGRGVVWEARILRNLLYEDSQRHGRIVPVLLESDARAFVPTVFRGHFYDLSDERGFESLLRHLLQEPGAEAGAIGSLGPQGSRWSAFERPWLVPDAMRSRHFTGRDDLLALLREQLVVRHRAALCGLGGIGKTQTAIEYAVRHRGDYPDGVFWTNGETTSGLTNGFVEIAKTLRLAAAATSDQEQVVRAVLEWLDGNKHWLLSFDNVNDLGDLASFLPQRSNGHVLITSREAVFQKIGIARGLEVVDLDGDDAVRFLFERTGRDDDDPEERTAVTELATELGNLPLALEQAAAYIAETNASFSDYVASFRNRRITLLEKSSGLLSRDTVAVTWAANFEAAGRASPAAAEVFRVSAFLAPDAVPFELFLKGADALGDPVAAALGDPEDNLAVGELLRPLTRYSLIRSDAKLRVYAVHRLVQEIVRAALAESERRRCVERAVVALDATFPVVEYSMWVQCDRLVSHVLSIAEWIDVLEARYEECGRLLNRAGQYLVERGRYGEAEPLQQRALAIRERAFGCDHPEVAESLHNLANVHCVRGRYAEARGLHERALAIRERMLGPDHRDVARTLMGLATVCWYQGRYAEAQQLGERALTIRERALGPDHPEVARSLNDIGSLNRLQGRFAEAQSQFERALAIWQDALGPDHPHVAMGLNNLALNHVQLGHYPEAQQLHERALALKERALGQDHPDVALSLNNLAEVLVLQRRFAEAQALYERALTICERALGPNHANLAIVLNNLAEVYGKQGRLGEAQAIFERALTIRERALGSDHTDVAYSLDGLASVHQDAGRYSEALHLFERALSVREGGLGPDHPELVHSLVGLASLGKEQGRNADAVSLYERALAIKERSFAGDHPDVVEMRSTLDALRAALAPGATSAQTQKRDDR